mmetsp:Transcript_19449/g.35944  ORF Transcript_19449/g.35944 Transcript_19449/m.35944 type:complete len:210 (+) Transcript_19449:212-841(+)
MGARRTSLLSWGREKSQRSHTSSTSSSSSSEANGSGSECHALLQKYGDLQLDSIVRNKAMLGSFLKFLQIQHAAENLTFFLMSEAFSLVFDENKATRLGAPVEHAVVLTQAKGIYDRFLAEDAPSWVCVSPRIVEQIEKRIKTTPEQVTSKVFDCAQEETRETLERDCLPRFTKCVLDRREVMGFELNEQIRTLMIELLQQQVTAVAEA